MRLSIVLVLVVVAVLGWSSADVEAKSLTSSAQANGELENQLYSHGSPIVEEFELQHEAGSEGEYETATSPRTISRRLSHRMNADRVLHMRSRTSAEKTMMKAKKPAAAAKKPPAATKKTSSTKSKSAASSSAAASAASPSSLTGTKSKDEVFSHFIVAFRKGYKDLATAKAKQATVKANTAKIDALNKRIRNNEPPVAQLVKSDVAATAAGSSSSSSSSTKKTNTKAKAKATTTRGKARFADVEMDAPKKTTSTTKSSKSSTKSAKSSKSSKSSSSSSSRKKKAVEATPAERSIAKTKLKPVSRRTAKQQQQRKLGRAVFGVNRFTDLTPAQFKAKYANSQPASQIVLAVKTKGEKKMNKMKSKKIPRRGVKSSSSSKSSSSKSSSKKPKSTTTVSTKTKKRSLIELAVNGPPPAKPPATKTSSTKTGGVTAASFANSNVAGGPSKPGTKTSSSSTSGVSASSFGNSNVGGGPAKTTTKTSSSNTGGTTSASFGNSNVGGGPSKPGTKTSSSSTSGTSSSSFGNSNVGGGPNDQGSATAAAPADDPVASAVAISPAGTWSDDEIADFQAQARLTPNVPYRKFNDFVDQPCDWSGVIPVIRATSGCGACWAVTTADAIQAAYFRTYGKGLKQVSSQGIMDCNFNAYNGGCKGGSLANAINSIIDNSVARKVNGGEVYFESDYPYRYNTDADAMHQQCKPKSGSPQSLVSTWAWAIPPAKMAVVDMTGFSRALQQQELAKQKGAVAVAGAAKIQAAGATLDTSMADGQKAIEARQQQVDALTKASDAKIAAGEKKVTDNDAECRRLDSVRAGLSPQLDAKIKQANSQRDAARDAFYAYERTDPYQGANRKDPVKYQQMRDLWTQADDNVKAVSKSNDDAWRAALDAASKCRSDASAYQTNWNQQRDQLRDDLKKQIAALPTASSIIKSHTQASMNKMQSASDTMLKKMNSFATMTAAELMDSFSGYASLSYGWYTNPEYVEVMSMQVSAEEKREILLARALNKYGPLAVIINAAELNSYAGGILQATDMMCSSAPEKGDHAIMLVGLAKDPATNRQYWILKNSWGTDWGNNGYLYLARGQNTCGLANAPARVAIKGDANDPVAVQQDAQIAAFLAGEPSSYTARE